VILDATIPSHGGVVLARKLVVCSQVKSLFGHSLGSCRSDLAWDVTLVCRHTGSINSMTENVSSCNCFSL